jgi:L,D-transpeptidase catalytic domain
MKDQLLRPEGQADDAGRDPGMITRDAPRPPAHRENARLGNAGGAPAPHAPPPPRAAGSSALASVIGFAAAAAIGGAVTWSSGCRNEPPPGPSVDLPPRPSMLPAPSSHAKTASGAPSGSASAVSAAPSASAAANAPDKPYTGPLLGGLMLQTVIFPRAEFSKKELGYVRLGGKVPVEPGIVKDASGKCSQGWYHLVDGGYVCARYATLDIKSPQIRLGITPPNLEDVLPYKYAHNSAHGTPLYRSVPSHEEMLRYEPYLEAAKKAKRKADREAEREKDKDDVDIDRGIDKGDKTDPLAADATADKGADKGSEKIGDKGDAVAKAESLGLFDLDGGAPEEKEKPWWQQVAEKGKPIHVKLDDLSQDADGTLAKRMVKGFFVAVDKQFGWNGRSWYKTTGGLVAPADRMYVVKPPTTQGADFPEGVKQLGFVLATHASKYEIDTEKKTVKADGSAARFTAVGLTGASFTHAGTVYHQTSEGWWMKAVDGTVTEPGPRPPDLGPDEKWIDVNLTRKTLVTFEGDKPVFGALIAPGKKSKDKEKDHSTVQGTFRIREKHIAVTMDGDGKAASDLPYSIEDVPYVEYFEGSYALHGAFWHNNFGHEMSHGCVNLSPLDAKKIFFWSEPKLPRGWHAVWSTPENRGTLVVVHE